MGSHGLGLRGQHCALDLDLGAWAYVVQVAFWTAFALNTLTLMFERQSSKFNLALLSMYINLIAALNGRSDCACGEVVRCAACGPSRMLANRQDLVLAPSPPDGVCSPLQITSHGWAGPPSCATRLVAASRSCAS
jgi:hypothetical protein